MELAQLREEPIEPDLPIVDTHHHIWLSSGIPDAPYPPYLIDDLIRDTTGGHNVIATIFAECSAEYRTDVPGDFAPVGETAWVVSQRPHGRGELAGIIAHADLRLGVDIGRVLDAHRDAGGDVFKGIRCRAAWDEHFAFPPGPYTIVKDILRSDAADAAMREVGARDLIFEAWVYHHQIDDFRRLAARHPNVRFVLEHLGCPLAVGPYADRYDEVIRDWKAAIDRIAELENMWFKIGGLGLFPAIHPTVWEAPRSSEWLAGHWNDPVRYAIDAFGADRCVMESDFPVDSPLFTYGTFWNVVKRITQPLSADERAAMFCRNALSLYRLSIPA